MWKAANLDHAVPGRLPAIKGAPEAVLSAGAQRIRRFKPKYTQQSTHLALLIFSSANEITEILKSESIPLHQNQVELNVGHEVACLIAGRIN